MWNALSGYPSLRIKDFSWESTLLSFPLHDRFYIIIYPPTCSDRTQLMKSTWLNFGKWNPCTGLRHVLAWHMLVTFLEQTSNQGSKLTYLSTCKVLKVNFFCTSKLMRPLAILPKSLGDMDHSNSQTFASGHFSQTQIKFWGNFQVKKVDYVCRKILIKHP